MRIGPNMPTRSYSDSGGAGDRRMKWEEVGGNRGRESENETEDTDSVKQSLLTSKRYVCVLLHSSSTLRLIRQILAALLRLITTRVCVSVFLCFCVSVGKYVQSCLLCVCSCSCSVFSSNACDFVCVCVPASSSTSVSIRPIRVYRRAAAGVALVVAVAAAVQRIPRSVLAAVPAAIRIVLLDDGRLLLDDL